MTEVQDGVPQTERAGESSRFPDGFVWGVATAAYQIEGGVRDDGRGRSIWDTFAHTPGAVLAGHTGDIAADHYRRCAEDVALMSALGVPAYRFSVSWPRVQPDGRGSVNPRGLDFYDRLVDELLAHEIAPMVTLYHWDLPQALQDAGGWPERETAHLFARYAELVAARLGDRVHQWTTLNEPWCSAFLGYGTGVHAPGAKDVRLALRAAHHLMLGHGLAVRALRGVLPSSAHLSIVLNPVAVSPASSRPEDQAAAEAIDGIANRLFLDPLFSGRYPEDVQRATSHVTDWSFARDDDLAVISAHIDALGLNYYAPTVVAANAAGLHEEDEVVDVRAFPGCDGIRFVRPPGARTSMDWLIDPAGLEGLLDRLHERLPGVPLLITENGAAFTDGRQDDRVTDGDRIRYLAGHLGAVHAAIGRGVDVRGYFVWSFLDNFEWAYGYSQRFGLVYVDYDSQERIPKDSALWYREVIRHNGVVPRPMD